MPLRLGQRPTKNLARLSTQLGLCSFEPDTQRDWSVLTRANLMNSIWIRRLLARSRYFGESI
jgi:hypothetical protein